MLKACYSFLAASLALGAWANTARAADAVPDTAPPACHDTTSMTLPRIPWMGKFYYKVSLKVEDGKPTDVTLQTLRGPDKASDRKIRDALQRQIETSYVCEGPDRASDFTVALNFKHDTAAFAATAKTAAAEDERLHAAASASAASASEADAPASTLVPVRAGAVCLQMDKPSVPRVNVVGKLALQVLVEVKDGAIGEIDAKLKIGSNDARLNQQFIDAVTKTIRDTYRCPGTHVFEQEFVFSMS